MDNKEIPRKQTHCEKTESEPCSSPVNGIEVLFHCSSVTNFVKDLTTIDINSADEVRQTIKAVLTSKAQKDKEIESAITQAEKEKKNPNPSSDPGSTEQDITKSNDLPNNEKVTNENQNNDIPIKDTPNNDVLNNNRNSKPRSQRPGRPPKAGPSIRKRRKKRSSNFYNGKLSNLIKSKNRKSRGRNSSDSDSVFFD